MLSFNCCGHVSKNSPSLIILCLSNGERHTWPTSVTPFRKCSGQTPPELGVIQTREADCAGDMAVETDLPQHSDIFWRLASCWPETWWSRSLCISSSAFWRTGEQRIQVWVGIWLNHSVITKEIWGLKMWEVMFSAFIYSDCSIVMQS